MFTDPVELLKSVMERDNVTPSARLHILDLPDEILVAIFRAVRGWQPQIDDHTCFWESPGPFDSRVG